MGGEGRYGMVWGDHVPIGIIAFDKSQTPSSSLRIVSGLRYRFSRSPTVWEGVGTAKAAGTKAMASVMVLEKSIVDVVVG